MLIVGVHLFFVCQSSIIAPVLTLQQPPSLGHSLLEGLVSCSLQEQLSRATLGSALLTLAHPPFCSSFVSLPCSFGGISCVLPIRLISIVNNRCGAPGNPPPLLVDCKGFWLFVMRFSPYPPQGAKSLCQRPGVILFCSVF